MKTYSLVTRFIARFASLFLCGTLVVGSLSVATLESACSSDRTCTSNEESACANTFASCISDAASSADRTKCQACVDAYCKCFDDCGTTCDRSRVDGQCGG